MNDTSAESTASATVISNASNRDKDIQSHRFSLSVPSQVILGSFVGLAVTAMIVGIITFEDMWRFLTMLPLPTAVVATLYLLIRVYIFVRGWTLIRAKRKARTVALTALVTLFKTILTHI